MTRRLGRTGLGIVCGAALCATVRAGPGMDYDGDGIADPAVYEARSGAWRIEESGTGLSRALNWGWPEAQPVPGDFDGDGIADPAVYAAHEGRWYIYLSGSDRMETFLLGGKNARPVAADYDGDGITDPAVYDRTTGTWQIRESSRQGRLRTLQFGWSEAVPVPADYDGDGKADPAVYHPAEGRWYLFQSEDGFRTFAFGYPGARPVPADYDGDGKADPAVYDRITGQWFGFGSRRGFFERQWGFRQARAVPADYDGDGRADLAVYHRETGRWYIWESGEHALRTLDLGGEEETPLASYAHGGIEGAVVLCFGDSITYGMGSLSNGPDHGYPARLERLLGPALGGHFHVVNVGIPGETTAQGLKRLDGVIEQHRPDWMLLVEGTNDHFFALSPSQIEANLRALIRRAQAAGVAVAVGSIPPVTTLYNSARAGQAGRIRSFHPRFNTIAVLTGLPPVPVYEEFLAHPNWAREMIAPRSGWGHHPNDEGYARMARLFLDALRGAQREGQFD